MTDKAERRQSAWVGYGVAVAVTAAAALGRWALTGALGAADGGGLLLFAAAVTVAVWVGGLLPGLAATGLGAAAAVFVPPASPATLTAADGAAVGLLAVVGVLISLLGDRLRWSASQAKASREALRGELARVEEQLRVAQAELASAEERYQVALARAVETDSKAYFQQVADHAPVMIWITEPDGACTFLSKSWYEYTGQTPESGLGFGWMDAVHPDERELVRATFLSANAEQEGFRLEYRLRGKSGEYFWAIGAAAPRFGPDGSYLGYIGSVIDISDRRRVEEALRTSEELFRTLADNLSQFAWMADPKGWIFWYNRRWFDYTGTTLAEMEGWGWKKVHHPDHVDGVVERLQRSWDTGEPWEDTFPLRGKDGEYRWFLSRALPIRDEAGRIVRWLGTNTDITENREMEHALRQADRRKDEFLATLAHELRGPLAPLRNMLEILKRADDDPELRQQARNTLERQLGQLVRLVDDLLDTSRISRDRLEIRKERVELASIVYQSVEACRPLIEQAEQELSVELPAEVIYLLADPVRLAQVFSNLLNNACKYTPAHGHIWLTAERTGADGGQVTVTVRDDGVGIPTEQLAEIFEMFAQVDGTLERSQGGLGIGLTLAKRLVELHDGEITARSAGAGQGSELIVRLPAVEAAPRQDPVVKPEEVPTAPAARRRILVVDDNRDSAVSLAKLLKLLGNETHAAFDGEEALAAARELRPDMIVLDIGLPKMSGYDVCRTLRAEPWGRDVVIVALSGWGQEEDRRRSHEAGFDEHFVKPVDPDALLKTLAGLDG